MRAAAILGLGSSIVQLETFARISDAQWQIGLPATHDDADAILLFGGDGTLHRHLADLVKLQLPLLVVPCGSGNDFARALGLRTVADAVKAWSHFVRSRNNLLRTDLGVISSAPSCNLPADTSFSKAGVADIPGSQSHYFAGVGGIGLDAEVARRANQLPRSIRRRGGYLLSLLAALVRFQSVKATVQALDENGLNVRGIRFEGSAMVIAFANAATYGGGIRIAPAARMDDGKLDVCVVGAMAKLRLLRLFPSVYSGRHLNIAEVEYFQEEAWRIETETPSEVYADGEYVCQTPVQVSVARAAFEVIVAAPRAFEE